MNKVRAPKKRRREKILLFFSFSLSMALLVSCLFCYFQSNIYAFFASLLITILLLINVLFFTYLLVKQKKYALISFASILSYFIFFNSPFQLNWSGLNDEKNAFSFMTFNTRAFWSKNNIRNPEKSKKITDFVKQKDPDIICFQEFSRFEFNTFSYYPYNFVGYRPGFEKTLQVIYSKYPIINKGFVDFPDTRNQCIFSDIDVEKEIIRIYNIHLQSYQLPIDNINIDGISFILSRIKEGQKKREEQVQIILKHAKTFKGKVIFSGDFNSTQYSFSYKRLKEKKDDTFLKRGLGLGSTFRLFDYPFRIDYVLVDKDIEVLSHQNFDLKLSDHEPILTKLVIN